jgi:hypothetical protein
MHILIGRKKDFKDQKKTYEWLCFDFNENTPGEIREHITTLVAEHEALQELNGQSYQLMTTNRTVLDMVERGYGIPYEDVYVMRDGEPSPLLAHYKEEWLSHFALGDLYNTEMVK